jgi:hypothetical protein
MSQNRILIAALLLVLCVAVSVAAAQWTPAGRASGTAAGDVVERAPMH